MKPFPKRRRRQNHEKLLSAPKFGELTIPQTRETGYGGRRSRLLRAELNPREREAKQKNVPAANTGTLFCLFFRVGNAYPESDYNPRISTMFSVTARMSSIVRSPMCAMRNVFSFRSP